MTEINEEPKIDENDETEAGGTKASPVETPEVAK